LIGYTVGIVEHLDQLWECLEDAGVGVAVHLDGVDQSDLGLGAFCKGLENGCMGLKTSAMLAQRCG
jgi:hypothetical protein